MMETVQFVEDLAMIKDCLFHLSLTVRIAPIEFHNTAQSDLSWAVNALLKIKASLITKHSFNGICGSSDPTFKDIECCFLLKKFQSRTGYASFSRNQLCKPWLTALKKG